MKSTIWTTPISNIKDLRVIDNAKVKETTHDSDMDVFTFYDVVHNKTRRSNLMDVSLYDDLIVEGEEKLKILRMLSK